MKKRLSKIAPVLVAVGILSGSCAAVTSSMNTNTSMDINAINPVINDVDSLTKSEFYKYITTNKRYDKNTANAYLNNALTAMNAQSEILVDLAQTDTVISPALLDAFISHERKLQVLRGGNSREINTLYKELFAKFADVFALAEYRHVFNARISLLYEQSLLRKNNNKIERGKTYLTQFYNQHNEHAPNLNERFERKNLIYDLADSLTDARVGKVDLLDGIMQEYSATIRLEDLVQYAREHSILPDERTRGN